MKKLIFILFTLIQVNLLFSQNKEIRLVTNELGVGYIEWVEDGLIKDTISRLSPNHQIVDYKFFEDGTVAFIFKLPTVAVFYKKWKKTENGFFFMTKQIGSESQMKLTKSDDLKYRIIGLNKVECVREINGNKKIESIVVKEKEHFVPKPAN